MSDQAAASTQVLVIIFGTIGIMGMWDGLVRRHIRLSMEARGLFIFLRGIAAILVGIVSTLPLYFAAGLEAEHVDAVRATCSSFSCVFRQTVLVLFLWPYVLGTLLFLIVFLLWLRGALELQGPFRRRMFAPGVWYEEKALVELVRKRLEEAQLPLVDDNVIIRTARGVPAWIRSSKDDPQVLLKNGNLDTAVLAKRFAMFEGIRARRKYPAHPERSKALQVMASTIVTYYFDRHEQAVEKWPWRRRLLGY
jgi:hypothetical protein